VTERALVGQVMGTCAACGRPMKVRRNPKGGGMFRGCTGFEERDIEDNPRCEETAPLPEHVRMQRMGAESLPGF
jgi:ssDNA-binding Zn-finger/Zn-ribbon topoisomerase 1